MLLAPAAARAADLTLVVTGLNPGGGIINYAVFDKPTPFPKDDDQAVARGKVPAKANEMRIVVTGLKPGRYAVTMFHDEDRNGKFNQGFLGIPQEQYGFSNDAAAIFGPPSFDEAAVTVGPEGATITIRLK